MTSKPRSRASDIAKDRKPLALKKAKTLEDNMMAGTISKITSSRDDAKRQKSDNTQTQPTLEYMIVVLLFRIMTAFLK